MTAPERIWAWHDDETWTESLADGYGGWATEYVRADLHDATKAQLAKTLEALRITLEWMETARACGDAGKWEWCDGDEYTIARAVLAEIEKGEPK